MTATSRWVFVLAVGATATALSLSILGGWQRGGSLSERAVWVAIGMVLVTSAHMLPALLRDTPILVRSTGSLLWVACLATACYGHAAFFILAQQHAGEQRASVVTIAPPAPGRNLTVVMADRAAVVRQLAWIDARRCSRDCTGLDARRVTLAAKLDALNAEADDVRRIEVERERVTAQRDSLLVDPVTSRLAMLLGMTTARIDLLSGLMFASVLEGVACLLWMLTLEASPLPVPVLVVGEPTPTAVAPVPDVTTVTAVTEPVVTSAAASHVDETANHERLLPSHDSTTHRRTPRDDPLAPLPEVDSSGDDMTRLLRDIAAGRLRPTVAEIRRHLGCSQAKAATLRRQLAARHTAA